MTDDLVEQLRALNPAPEPLDPPPIDHVLRRIGAAERPAGRRWTQWVAPAFAVVIAAAVGTVAVISLHAGRHGAVPARHPTRPTTADAAQPGPGNAMRGSLRSPVVGFGAAGTGVIGWTQFNAGKAVRPKSWLATTSDSGRSWSIVPQSFSLFADPVFDGSRDAWAQAINSQQTLRFFVSHDGGRTWRPALSAAAADSVTGDVSVAGGVVWAVGTGSCVGTACRWVVMRGPAAGNRLPATAGQPLPATNQNSTTISASSATTAYVATPARHGTAIYGTSDGGRRWHRIQDQCSSASSESWVTATTAGALWRVCVRAKQFFAVRSTDGGARGSSTRLPFIPLYAFEPVSGQVAWSQSVSGTIYRTADGGASWQPVWHSGGSHGRPLAGSSPLLSAQSADAASLLVQLTRGPRSRDAVARSTNLIVYRTSDAGRTWHQSVLQLPHG